MAEAVHQQRVYSRIGGQNLPVRARCRVALKHDGNIFFDVIKHNAIMPQGSAMLESDSTCLRALTSSVKVQEGYFLPINVMRQGNASTILMCDYIPSTH